MAEVIVTPDLGEDRHEASEAAVVEVTMAENVVSPSPALWNRTDWTSRRLRSVTASERDTVSRSLRRAMASLCQTCT